MKKLLILLIILLVVILAACAPQQAYTDDAISKEHAKDSAAELSEYIRQGKADELSLTIYYMDPSILTLAPVYERDLIESWFEYKITVSGDKLRDHIDLLDKLANADLTPAEEKGSEGFARVYYVFEAKNNRKIFSVCMWSGNGGIFVNGVEVEADNVLYNVIIPFLPEDAAEKIEKCMD